MARKARESSSTGIYHIMMRGINHQNIFLDNSDKYKFLSFMQRIIKRNGSVSGKSSGEYDVFAYALMGNHFHILINVVSGTLGDFVKALASSYVMYFNNRYQRDGHLFKERFKSEPCETEEYLVTLLRYIHQNPLKAGICNDLMRYQYTSWQEYADPLHSPFSICNTDIVLSKIPLDSLTALIYDILPETAGCMDIDNPARTIPDHAIVKYLNDKHGITSLEEARQMSRKQLQPIAKQLLEYGAGICQLERLLGVSKATISRIKNGKTAQPPQNETK